MAMTMATMMMMAQAAGSIVQGMQQQSAYNDQAEAAKASAAIAAKEQVRQSFKEAEVEKANIADTERRQKLAYLSSGVTLEGSPLLIMEETRNKGAQNIDEIYRGGAAAYGATITEGRNRASELKAAGRQAFSSGITNSMGSFAKIK